MKCAIILFLAGSLCYVQASEWSLTKNLVLGNMPQDVVYADVLHEFFETHLVNAIDERNKTSKYEDSAAGVSKAADDLLHDEQRVKLDDSNDDRLFVEATKLVASLPQVINECDYNSYMLLAKSFRAAVGNQAELRPSNPINRAILDTIEEHGNFCRPKYYQNFRDVYEKVEADLKSKVDLVIDPEVIRAFLGSTDIFEVLRGSYFPNGYIGVTDALRSKLNEARASEGEPIGNKELTHKYLIEPCQQFKQQLEGVFYPARVDVALDQSKISEINPTNDQAFFDTWLKFEVCDGVAYSAHLFESVMDQTD